ncbi:hypothetical protein E8E13_001357 [Curvularia kusanoi]|uniref:Uncharacterized protein n=1 Tax=Curvularia kusanoi TaxID=90978 RepID=A0A9P4T4H9_CURKU|nr:hypothetical protein E8E13_001357 [Curvularia kusanoi]
MSSFKYYSAPGFGQVTREQYGFSDACVIGNRIEVTGQVGFHPDTLEVPSNLEAEVAQAFDNLNTVILHIIKESGVGKPVDETRAWDNVVKITSYHVGLSQKRAELREIMVKALKERFRNHQPLFTMVGVESLPLEETNVEVEAVVYVN